MTKLPDLEPYTVDETRQIAIDAMNLLPLDQRVKAVLEAFGSDARAELILWLEDDEQGD